MSSESKIVGERYKGHTNADEPKVGDVIERDDKFTVKVVSRVPSVLRCERAASAGNVVSGYTAPEPELALKLVVG